MAIKMHRLSGREHFQILRDRWSKMNEKSLKWLSDGTGDPQACYRYLCENSIALGCMALILVEGDSEARRHFSAAAEYAIRWLEAPPSKGAPRIFDVQAEADETGVRVTSEQEIPQREDPARMSVIGFGTILNATVAFGDRAGMEKVGGLPEKEYQSTNVVAPTALFEYYRAWKALLLGDTREARKAATRAKQWSREPWPLVNAFMSLTKKDEAAFRRDLAAALEVHKKEYRRQPNSPEGFVHLDGLAICRVALDQGIDVEDGPYLPVRLLPG